MGRHRGWRFIIKPAGSKIRGRPAVIKRVQQRSAPHRKTLAPRKAGALLSAATTARLNVSSRLAPLKRPRHPGAVRVDDRRFRGDLDGSRAIPSRPARVQREGRYTSAAEKRGIIAGSRESTKDISCESLNRQRKPSLSSSRCWTKPCQAETHGEILL